MADSQPIPLAAAFRASPGTPGHPAEWAIRLVALLGILACAAVLAVFAYGQQVREARVLVETVGRLKAAEVGVWLRERDADVRFLETHSVLGRLNAQSLDGDVAATLQLRQRLEEFRLHNGFATVAVAQRDGQVTQELGQSPGFTAAQVPALVRRAAERVIVDISPNGEAALTLVAALPGVDTRPGAVALVRVDPVTSLAPLLQEAALPEARLLLARREAGEVRVFSPERALSRLDEPLLQGLAGLDDENPVELRDGRGQAWVVMVKPLAQGRMSLALIVDRGELHQEAVLSALWAGFGSAIAMLAATALALNFRQRQRLRLESLRQGEREARLHTAELLDAVVESSPDAIYAKDRDGRYLLCNEAAAALIGRRRDLIEGRLDEAFFPAPIVEVLRRQDRDVLSQGRTVTFEEQVALPGGMRTFLTTKGPLRAPDGGVRGTFGVSRDITERRAQDDQRRAIAERLRESEAHYRSIVSALSEGVIEVGAGGEVRAVNASAVRILDMPEAELRASWAYFSDWSTVREDGTPFSHERLPLVQVLATGHPQHGIVVGVTHPRSGRLIWLRMNAEPVFDSVGAVAAAVISFLDITERVALDRELARHREDLEALVKARTAMLESTLAKVESFGYTISHDLRAPLRAIHGFASLLQESAGGSLDEEARRHLGRVLASAEHMNALLEDIHAFSRADQAPMKLATVDLGSLARQVAARLSADHPRAHIEVRELPAVLADAAMMRQVLGHLIGNALKFSAKADSPRVEVGCEPAPDGPEVYVRDNGVGFDMRYAGQLFGLFKRLHREGDFPGTGLGLAIVKHLVERHGGRVAIHSVEGVGTTVRFSLGAAGPSRPAPSTGS